MNKEQYTHQTERHISSIALLRQTSCTDILTGVALKPLEDNPDAREQAYAWYSDQAVYEQFFGLKKAPSTRFKEVEFRHALENPITATYEINHPTYGSIGHVQAHSIDWYSLGCTYGVFIGDAQYRGKGIGSTVRALLFATLQSHRFSTVRFDILSGNDASLQSLARFNPQEIAPRHPGVRSFLMALSSWQPPEWVGPQVIHLSHNQ